MNKTTFKQFLESDHLVLDSINDKGRLKAIFIAGIPGAGKSYTVKTLSGSIQPAVVNIDRATEWITHTSGIESSSENWETHFKDRTERMTKNALYHQINGIRPLFIDGTTSNPDSIFRRAKILKSLGYDVGMIFVRTDLDVALNRAKKRAGKIGRHVDEQFIRAVHSASEENISKFSSYFEFFKIYENNIDQMDNTVIEGLFTKTQKFFNGPIENKIGIDIIEKLSTAKQSYLVPTILSDEQLKSKVSEWYMN